MDNLDFLEFIGYIFFGIFSAISGAIITIINRKRVRKNLETVDYNEQKPKRKSNYTRNLMLNYQIVARIKEEDNAFDENEFKEWAKKTFIEFYKAWSNKDMSNVRNRLDYNLFEQNELLLQTNIDDKSLNIIEIKKINYVDLSAYSKDNEKEIIEVAINVILKDYTIDEKTSKIISGSKTIKERTTYIMKFYRKVGAKTEKNNHEHRCPNCGANLKTEENKCEYCNTIIISGVKQWILNSMDKY